MLNETLRNQIGEYLRITAEAAGFNTAVDLLEIVAGIIAGFLSLLGVIFICLIMYGGFVWMTSGGNETKVYKAKKIIQNSIIGVVIIVSSYAITSWVFSALKDTIQ